MEAPPVIAPTPERQFAVNWPMVVVVGAVIATGTILYLFNPSQYGFYPRCELFVMTGIYCPGCGSLRAMHYLTHGNFLIALRYNALLILSLPTFAIHLVCALAGRPLPRWWLQTRVLIWLGVVVVVFTVLRNIHSAPFIYLAPP